MDKNTWFDDTKAGRIEAGGWEITGELSPNVAPPATHHLLPTPSWNSWSATPNRVGQSSGQNDSSTRSSTRSISIEDRDVTSDDYQSYCVKFFSDQIHTILTHIPAIVDDWVADIRRTHQQTLKNLIVGLDVEWRPNFNRGIENKVAILQLCVDHSCLIFQILHADHVPASLIEFLNNPNFKFVGVGIQGDVEKLLEDYELNVMNTIDLRTLAAKKLKMPKLKSSGLKDLTREVLGKEIDKPRKVTMSRWDTEWLTHDQVQYACVDAFLSFEIGRSLMSGN